MTCGLCWKQEVETFDVPLNGSSGIAQVCFTCAEKLANRIGYVPRPGGMRYSITTEGRSILREARAHAG